MKKHYHKRFGNIAVEKEYINEEQLLKALEKQAKENLNEGKHRLLGQILIDEGLNNNVFSIASVGIYINNYYFCHQTCINNFKN